MPLTFQRSIRYFRDADFPPGVAEAVRQEIAHLQRVTPPALVTFMIAPDRFLLSDDTLTTLPQAALKTLLTPLVGRVFDSLASAAAEVTTLLGRDLFAQHGDAVLTAMRDPSSGTLVPALLPPFSSQQIELVIAAVQEKMQQIAVTNSNPCRCAEEYAVCEQARQAVIAQFATQTDETLTRAATEKRLRDIDDLLKARFKNTVPPRIASSFDDPPCPLCHKPRRLDETLAFLHPAFFRNLVTIITGGEVPLVSVLTILESFFRQVYDPDACSDAKKKQMAAFVTTIHLDTILTQLKTKLLTALGVTWPDGATASPPNATATATSLTSGDSSRPMWTPDSPLTSETGSMMNG